jgi:hypothetical protein
MEYFAALDVSMEETHVCARLCMGILKMRQQMTDRKPKAGRVEPPTAREIIDMALPDCKRRPVTQHQRQTEMLYIPIAY